MRGAVYRTDQNFRDLNVTAATTDGNLVAASNCWISVLWQSNTGGTVGILPITGWGPRSHAVPLIQAHSAQIQDLAWNPFHAWVLATAAADGNIRLWKLPEHGLTGDINADSAQATLAGHGKRVDTIAWHPSAVNVLASGGPDATVRVWDITTSNDTLKVSGMMKDAVDSVSWNWDGSLLAVTSRDKKLRVLDPRSGTATAEADSHKGAGKPSRATWMGRKDRIITTGFSQMRDREVFVWDPRNMAKPIKQLMFDASPGVLVPLYDADTDLVWMSGRGDSSIRTFEVVDDATVLYELNPVVDKTPHRGIALTPKLCCDVMTAEVGRVLKVTNNSIVPIGFSVPRKSYRDFHADVFPDTAGPDPAQTAEQYFSGSNAEPLLVKVQPPASSEDNGAAPESTESAPASTPAASSPAVSNPRGGPVVSNPQPALKPGSLAPGAKKGPVRPHSVSISVKKGEELKLENPDDYYVPKDISIVRQSHFKHIFGRPANRVDCYDDLRVLNDAMQTRTLRANKKWFACSWQGVGGRLAVFNLANDKGRVTPPVPRGKIVDPSQNNVNTIEIGSALIDFDFNPFDDDMVVTGAENALIKVWRIPEGGVKTLGKNLTEPIATIRGHNHKIITTDFHPFAKNLLFSTSGDFTGRFWDIETQQEHVKISGFTDLVTSVTWNFDASLVGVSSKDRKIRLYDPRAGNSPIFECADIGGTLGTRIEWMGAKDQIALVGFDKASERRIQVVDFKKGGARLADQRIDSSSGVLNPVYDHSTGVLLLWGKGETSIKFWELNDQAPYAHALTDYQTTVPQLGVAVAPRHDCNVRDVEIFKVLKLTQDTCDPVSFIVPRQRKEFFQDDIYPPLPAREPVCSASEWAAGSKAQPKMVDLKPADMQRLSEAPKIVRVVKKFKQDEEEELDAEAIKNRLVDKFYQQMMDFKEEDELEKAPGDDLEGVADDEWDD